MHLHQIIMRFLIFKKLESIPSVNNLLLGFRCLALFFCLMFDFFKLMLLTFRFFLPTRVLHSNFYCPQMREKGPLTSFEQGLVLLYIIRSFIPGFANFRFISRLLLSLLKMC